jgi:hypothetical protein
MPGGRSLRLPPEKSILKFKVGDVVKLNEAGFPRLSKAFFAALEEMYLFMSAGNEFRVLHKGPFSGCRGIHSGQNWETGPQFFHTQGQLPGPASIVAVQECRARQTELANRAKVSRITFLCAAKRCKKLR